MKQKILLSIICPAYNAEKTISKLIESIVLQKFKNYELIILNDGSKDKTFAEIKKYSKKYKNIIAIDKPNTGVGDTRNEGLKIARGEYITFADSDDYYSDNYFNDIIPLLKKGDFDLLCFNMAVMNNNKFERSWLSSKYKNSEFIEKNGVQKYLNGDFRHRLGSGPCNKIYVKRIIDENKIVYEKNKKRGQDLLFNIWYASKISQYKYINKNLYYYNLDMNLVTTSLYREADNEENIKFYKPIKKICQDNNISNYEHYMGLFFLRNLPGTILNESNNNNYFDGKNNIEYYLTNDTFENIFKKIRFNNLDFKLFICFVIYKFRLYNMIYYMLWHKQHRKGR